MQGKVEICGVNTSKLQTLSNAEMMRLIERSQQGDMDARSRLVEGNLKLVLSVVQRFLSRGENPDDLFQVGCIGLLKAIANFDTTKNVRFSTYGVPMIAGELRRYLRDYSPIRVSRSLRDTAYRVLQGIDVSTFQQDIDWQAVADSGIAFAVIRAGYRGYGKGSIVEDDRFRQNVAGARAAGLHVGLYFFSQAVTPEEAAEEAQWLVDAAHDYQIDMPLVFDWENIDQSTVAAGDTVRTAEMTGEDVTACAVAFCETVTAAGYDAAVYGNRWQGYYDYDFTQLKDYAFWVSAPGTADDFYYAHDFWQYSYDGTVPGISGSVDRDLWFVPITT